MIGEFDLSRDLEKIQTQWAPVLEVLENPGLFDLNAAEVSAWSCGLQAGHIAKVCYNIARGIENNLADPSRNQDEEVSGVAAGILGSGQIPRGVAPAPEGSRPEEEGLSRNDFLVILREAQDLWGELAPREEKLAATEARFPHFALGFLNSSEWVRFCAIHTAHHIAIIRDIRAQAGAPLPDDAAG